MLPMVHSSPPIEKGTRTTVGLLDESPTHAYVCLSALPSQCETGRPRVCAIPTAVACQRAYHDQPELARAAPRST